MTWHSETEYYHLAPDVSVDTDRFYKYWTILSSGTQSFTWHSETQYYHLAPDVSVDIDRFYKYWTILSSGTQSLVEIGPFIYMVPKVLLATGKLNIITWHLMLA